MKKEAIMIDALIKTAEKAAHLHTLAIKNEMTAQITELVDRSSSPKRLARPTNI